MGTVPKSSLIVFNSETTKDDLNLVIHHPYNIYPNIEYIKTISNIDLFTIIQHFIDIKNDNQLYKL